MSLAQRQACLRSSTRWTPSCVERVKSSCSVVSVQLLRLAAMARTSGTALLPRSPRPGAHHWSRHGCIHRAPVHLSRSEDIGTLCIAPASYTRSLACCKHRKRSLSLSSLSTLQATAPRQVAATCRQQSTGSAVLQRPPARALQARRRQAGQHRSAHAGSHRTPQPPGPPARLPLQDCIPAADQPLHAPAGAERAGVVCGVVGGEHQQVRA